MKVLILASAFTAMSAPFAFATETDLPCQVEDRRVPQVRIDSGAPGGSAPQATPTNRPAARAPTTETQAAERQAAEAARSFAERRRSGKRIPDAELIGPRGAL
ncbi:MAG TPA: hypothetical protein VEA80_01340 [Vitreimonas sp.]|uniref:hypothetical protein n=1 Tax=Vitreimonas sp. TaxID=3069702 RepID=UPI002D38E728|nr:hypothetical protein [Vitreimonas sp.]HYD86095.1 hypothetical protein [Vitreimonas sp.]